LQYQNIKEIFNMNNMKKLMAILLTAAMVLTLAACDSGGGVLSQADADRLQK